MASDLLFLCLGLRPKFVLKLEHGAGLTGGCYKHFQGQSDWSHRNRKSQRPRVEASANKKLRAQAAVGET